VKGTRCVGADIGTHDEVAGHLGSGSSAAAGREFGAGGGGICDVSPKFS
jgi:hypothetical protein